MNEITDQDFLIGAAPSLSQLNACIGPQLDDGMAFDAYCEGFRRVAKKLGEETIEGMNSAELPVDIAVYPLVFLYRHYLELRFKILIVGASTLNNDPQDPPTGHRLDSLWAKAKAELERAFPNYDWTPNEQITRLIQELCSVDPKGQAGRYPVNNQGNKHFDDHPILNIAQFHVVIEKVCDYLDGLSCDVENALDHVREMKASIYTDNRFWE